MREFSLLYFALFLDFIDAYLDPVKSLAVVPVEHEGNRQPSKEEALWIAQAVKRLILDY